MLVYVCVCAKLKYIHPLEHNNRPGNPIIWSRTVAFATPHDCRLLSRYCDAVKPDFNVTKSDSRVHDPTDKVTFEERQDPKKP